MNRLLQIGFTPSGHWRQEVDRIRCELTRHATQKNVLYAFVCDGQVMYVGKSVMTLARRMAGYQNPGPTQSTNIRNNARILEQLRAGAAVDILALPDSGLHHYGVFHLNLAAGLEDSIIRTLTPPWNGGRVLAGEDAPPMPMEPLVAPRHAFRVTLQQTYYRTGFFNVGVNDQQWFAGDGESIELFLGDAREPVLGAINRRANRNGTPRVLGGTQVRDWLQQAASPGAELLIEVYSPMSIRLRLPSETP